MARDFAYAFYHSAAWRKCRDTYMRMGEGLCEPCLARGVYTPAVIVHHKVKLTPENIDDPEVTLNFEHLERVCRKCHADEHPEIYPQRQAPRVWFDKDGNVVRIPHG